jgi:multidrug efflux system membrane fusion protein
MKIQLLPPKVFLSWCVEKLAALQQRIDSLPLKKSYLAALAILGLVVLWLLSGSLMGSDKKTADNAPATEPAMTVTVRHLGGAAYSADIVVQGRTEAVRRVDLKAQTDGKVEALPVNKGAAVKAGQVVCRLAVDDRAARLAEAKALAAQRRLEFNAATELAAKGHRSETQVAAAKAHYDAALAGVRRMEVELSFTEIRAPFDGILDQRHVEIGAYLQKGNPCATLLDIDPYLVVGEVSERNVAHLAAGMPARATLVDGREMAGKLRYVAAAGKPETRTFRIELEVDNKDGSLKDGVTAQIHIPVAERQAHVIPSSALVLSDKGVIGVRVVDGDIVRFREIKVIGDDARGVWVSGLDDKTALIVVGQQFVKEGDRVQVQAEVPVNDRGAT